MTRSLPPFLVFLSFISGWPVHKHYECAPLCALIGIWSGFLYPIKDIFPRQAPPPHPVVTTIRGGKEHKLNVKSFMSVLLLLSVTAIAHILSCPASTFSHHRQAVILSVHSVDQQTPSLVLHSTRRYSNLSTANSHRSPFGSEVIGGYRQAAAAAAVVGR